MDKESLTLIINGFDKTKFDSTIKIALNEILGLSAVNVECLIMKKGMPNALQTEASYCIVMDRNAHVDREELKKKLRKYRIKYLYFIYKFNKTEGELTKQGILFSADFGISVNCMNSRILADLLIDSGKEGYLFEDKTINRSLSSTDFDYIAAAFHSLTIAEPDVLKLKGQVYDDAILFKISTNEYTVKEELIQDVISYLSLPTEKSFLIEKRLDSLLTKGQINKDKETGVYQLRPEISRDIADRKKAYLYELNTLSAAQTDLMREDFHTDWSEDDSRVVSTLLSLSAIDDKISILRDAKSNIDHPIFRMAKGSDEKIKRYLVDQKKLSEDLASIALDELAQLASNHPLIIKITRACMYLALEGSNPLSSVKALGANSWADFNIMLEPTVAIPYICSQLYDGQVTKSFETSVNSVKTAVKRTKSVSIPFFYVNECAGHLLTARKYDGLDLDPEEMAHSNNAFVSNYYSLLLRGVKLPPTFLDYLSTFSPAIRNEKPQIKKWVREIMTDISSLLLQGNVTFSKFPTYSSEDLKDYETDFSIYLRDKGKEKAGHLIHHDAMALKYINDCVRKLGEHWIILSYDGMLTSVGNNENNDGWICTPQKFLDLTSITIPLSDTEMVSVLHSVASFSEKTLAIGAQIMDRIIRYAANDMQRWEFKQELDKFKSDMKSSFSNIEDPDDEIIERTDLFLKSQGIEVNEDAIEEAIEDTIEP